MATSCYIYMDHLLSLAEWRPALPADLLWLLGPVNTPLNVETWANHLQSHLDRAYVDYIHRKFSMVSGWVLITARCS